MRRPHVLALCLALGSAFPAIPQQPSAPAPAVPVPAMPLNALCSVQFDTDNSISTDSLACLDLLASTLEVNPHMRLLLTGTAAHIRSIESYLTANESVSASAIRTQIKSADEYTVHTSLVNPPVRMMAPPVAEAAMMAAPAEMATAPPPVNLASRSRPASNPYALGDQAAAWKASLRNGAIEYNVPPVMIAQQASTVTVIVHGYKDPNPHVLTPGKGTASATLKVSDSMEVDLIGSPTEFTITPQATPSTQFVPIDGYSTWIWSVTPINKATSQQLTIKVSLIPDASSGLPAQPLAETPYTVNVTVESLWSVLSDRWHQDPMKAIEYILPGGAGWAALGTLLTTLGVGTWLRNKLNKPAPTASTANQKPTPAV